MAPKKKKQDKPKRATDANVVGLHAAILDQHITDTLEKNYMPYAMSVIVSRAIPEIDGFKPSHRKLLYTMYKAGLLGGQRTKSANVVGQTMRLNPHGESAIYETMVRMTRGCEALLHPFVDSKGNFGKVYSRDMAYAASRYTEVRLDQICTEIFGEIDRDTVDFVDNYDNTMKEPVLLPTTFPNVLVTANQGIAVGMASMMCGFNLTEVCETTIEYLKNPAHDIISTLPAPDFPTGGELIYDVDAMREIYRTGRGGFRVRAKWRYNSAENLIEVFEIPYTTTIEAIIDKIAELIKSGRIREISDLRDETDLNGLKIAIDLKRGTDPDKLMQRLFKMSPLMDSFSCNFNILVGGSPRVMGVAEILSEWTAWRRQCLHRKLTHDLAQLSARLHLLEGLKLILLDIDKAIRIIRETEQEKLVVPNLMEGFGIDQLQADYIAEIRLRNINREFILKRTQEIDSLKAEIDDINQTLGSDSRIKSLIIADLKNVIKKFGIPRHTDIIHGHEVTQYNEQEHIEDYPVHLFLSCEGYFKKITPASLRMNSEQKYKENDGPNMYLESTNKSEILLFTNKQQCYKARLYEFDDGKSSILGDYLPSKLGMDDGENVLFMCSPADYSGSLLFFFKNGKCARVELSSYATLSNRRRLTGAFSDKSPLVSFTHIVDDADFVVKSTDGRMLIFCTDRLAVKSTRSTVGVSVMTLKGRHSLAEAGPLSRYDVVNVNRYRVHGIPGPGAPLKSEDEGIVQITFGDQKPSDKSEK